VRAVATAGAGESVQTTPGKHGSAAHPSASMQAVSPVPTVPRGTAWQILLASS